MSVEENIFDKKDFKNVCFYYFLPFYTYVKKNEIGEKINQFNGVYNYFYIILSYNILQTISFTLKENIYILIEKESDIETNDFNEEILNSGNIYLYKNKKKHIIECNNKEIKNPCKYNCLLLNGKSFL